MKLHWNHIHLDLPQHILPPHWPRNDHDEPDEKAAAEKVASGAYSPAEDVPPPPAPADKPVTRSATTGKAKDAS